jgi:hypothetical protein
MQERGLSQVENIDETDEKQETQGVFGDSLIPPIPEFHPGMDGAPVFRYPKGEHGRATGYGKELNKELFSPVVVPVAEGKVEIWRILLLSLDLSLGRVLENWPVELRASGKVGKEG